MNRNDVTEKIVTAKVAKGIKWADVAEKVGQSRNGPPPPAWAR